MGKLNHKYGLRTVAVFEALKGAAVIALCAVLLSLLHQDLNTVVDQSDGLVAAESRLAGCGLVL